MVLVIDVGNTNMVFGVFDGGKLVGTFRIATASDRTADELGMFITNMFIYEGISKDLIGGVVISSVVPPVMYSLRHAVRKYFNIQPILVDNKTPLGIKILIDNPSEIGADRIVNAVAAHTLYGGPLIVIDFGTATTFCAISPEGDYLGGVICPGVKIALESLYQNTAKLPRVDLEKPPSVLGKNTVNSMRSGILYGYVGQVEYLVKRLKTEIGTPDVKVVATGGLARMIANETTAIDTINPLLTLEGLNIIYTRKLRGISPK